MAHHFAIYSLFALIYADNFILHKEDFDTITIDGHEIPSKFLGKDQVLQISFPGIYIYKLKNDNRKFKILDETVYLKRRSKRLHVFLTVSTIRYGLFCETWPIVWTLCGLFIVSFIPYLCLMLIKT